MLNIKVQRRPNRKRQGSSKGLTQIVMGSVLHPAIDASDFPTSICIKLYLFRRHTHVQQNFFPSVFLGTRAKVAFLHQAWTLNSIYPTPN